MLDCPQQIIFSGYTRKADKDNIVDSMAKSLNYMQQLACHLGSKRVACDEDETERLNVLKQKQRGKR